MQWFYLGVIYLHGAIKHNTSYVPACSVLYHLQYQYSALGIMSSGTHKLHVCPMFSILAKHAKEPVITYRMGVGVVVVFFVFWG